MPTSWTRSWRSARSRSAGRSSCRSTGSSSTTGAARISCCSPPSTPRPARRSTWTSPPIAGLGFPLAQRYAADSLEDARTLIEGPLFDNTEGVVVRFESGLRLRLKREEYQRLHRIITGVTPRRIWEMLKDGTPPIDRLFTGTPAPLQTWSRAEIDKIETRRAEIEGASQEAYRQIVEAVPAGDRKAFAMQAPPHHHRAILFKMYDNQPYDEIVWRLVRPGPDDPFRVEV